ncbi:MAG: DUF503 domain-containing protein [Anaerolineae bacterium]|nr:DUF503 domain-containing protein [Anaerolineae bacterium]
MIIGACELELYLPEAGSLKGKRSVIKSLLARVRNVFNVSAAEVGHQDLWQSATLGIVTVTNSSVHADQTLTHVIHWIEDQYPQVMIVNQSLEIIT